MDPDVSQPDIEVPEEPAPPPPPPDPEPTEISPELPPQEPSVTGDTEAPEPVSSPAIATPPLAVTDPMVTATPSVISNPPAPAWDPHSAEEINFVKTVLTPKAIAARQAKARKRIERLMDLARKKGAIDRNDARLLLKVSQATATRYLTELVHEGRLVRKHILNDNVYTVK